MIIITPNNRVEKKKKKNERITSVDIVCPVLSFIYLGENLKESFSFLFFLQCSLNPKVKRTAKIDFTAKEKRNLNSENQRAPLYLHTLLFLLFSALYNAHVFMINSKQKVFFNIA